MSASKGSYVELQYGQVRPFEAGRPLQVLDGQTIERVDFSLPRGSVITGKVLDEFGEAMADVQVMAMRNQFFQGRRQVVPAGVPRTTNDIGEYRIFGLAPGQYYVSATLRTASLGDVVSADRSGYAPTYYPGTPIVSEARRLSVGLGETLHGIDLALAPARLSRVSGTVVDSDGRPLAGGVVMMLQSGGPMVMAMFGGQVRPDGSFVVSNVAPGDYTLRVAGTAGSGGPGAAPDVISARVTVAGEDITGLQLVGVKPTTASGRIILPHVGNSILPSSLQLTAMPAEPDLFAGGNIARVHDDFTFEMKVQPGRQLIRLAPMAQGVALKAVRLDGLDVTDSGIDVKPNENVSGLEVELTQQLSELSGLVTDTGGQAVKDYSLVVFARDPERWTATSRYFGGARPDQEGRFKIRNLPPGDYYAIALDYVEPGSGTDPDVLDRIKDRATAFSLVEGEAKVLELRPVTSP